VAQALAVRKAGFDMHVHVDADGSARTVLNSLEAVQKQLGRGGRRHTITHNSTVSPKDIPRYKQPGVLANCQPMWGTNYNGKYIETFTKALGGPAGSRKKSSPMAIWCARAPSWPTVRTCPASNFPTFLLSWGLRPP